MAVAKNNYLEQMNASIRQPMHHDTMQILELEIIKRFKGIGGAVPFIVGPKGSGKTTVMATICHRQASIGRIVGLSSLRDGFDEAITNAIHAIVQGLAINLRQEALASEVSTAHDRLRYEAISGTGPEALMRATDGLVSVLADVSSRTKHGIVLMLDDADTIDAHQLLGLTDAVLALSETGAPIPVICSSSTDKRDSRWTRSQSPVRIRPKLQDVVELSLSLGLRFEREDLEIVHNHCEGNLYDATDRLLALGRHLNQIPAAEIEVRSADASIVSTNPIDPFRALRKSERRQLIRDKQTDSMVSPNSIDE